MTGTTVAQVMAEPGALEDPRAGEVDEGHGDDHGVNLGQLRAPAKRLRTQQELARQLCGTTDTAAGLLAILICRPKAFERDWSTDPDPVVASAGWVLTAERMANQPAGLDLAGLLDVIEAEMSDAPDHVQWAMNHCTSPFAPIWITEMMRRQNHE